MCLAAIAPPVPCGRAARADLKRAVSATAMRGHGCRAGGGGGADRGGGADPHRLPTRLGHFVVGEFAALHFLVIDPVTVHVGVEILVGLGLIERADLHGGR